MTDEELAFKLLVIIQRERVFCPCPDCIESFTHTLKYKNVTHIEEIIYRLEGKGAFNGLSNRLRARKG